MAFGMMSNGMTPIAIDFGVGAIKALQIAPGDSPSLIAGACLATPDELRHDAAKRFDFQIQALPALLKGAGFKGKKAICSIPAAHTLIQHMRIQQTEGVPLASLVRAQLQSQLNCDPSRLIIMNHEVTQVSNGKTEIICTVASKDLIFKQIQALKSCKLETVGVHSEHTAMHRAFDHMTRRAQDASIVSLYLDIGAETTKIVIAHGTSMVFAKTINLAGRALDMTVAKQLNCSLSEARARRLAMTQLTPRCAPQQVATPTVEIQTEESGMTDPAMHAADSSEHDNDGTRLCPDTDHAAVAEMDERRVGELLPGTSDAKATGSDPQFDHDGPDLTDPLESLTDEIAMCIRYHRALFPGKKIERAIFVGGEATHLGLCEHIARTLRLPARVADPLAHVARSGTVPARGIDFSSPQPGLAVTYGLTLCPIEA